MEIRNSKAYYLKNYPSRHSNKSQVQRKLPSLSKRSSNNIEQIAKFNKIHRSRRISYPRNNQSPLSTHSNLNPSHSTTKTKKFIDIFEKEKQILKKVIDSKMQKQKRRVHTISTNQDFVLLQKHPLSGVTSIEVESMKPTQRYFHLLNNVRIAENLLLAKPSKDCSMKNCQQFYTKQNSYKHNITKLGFKSKRENELSRLKLLNRKKWID